jgi:hypothetical protein
MVKQRFSLKDIQDRLTLTLIFERPNPKSSFLDLYLAGYLKASFEIMDEIGDFKAEDNAFIVDKVKLNPRKAFQALVGKKLTFEEIKKELGENFSEGKVDELIKTLHKKINLINDKQKLYGKELKNFNLA